MDDLKSLALEILKDGFVMNLAVADEQGVWVAPVTYIYDDDLNLFWKSAPTVRHSIAIEKNPKVACTIIADHNPGQERALQIEGMVEKVDADLEKEKKLQTKRRNTVPSSLEEIQPDGRLWYKLIPNHIELIHDKLFGRQRKKVL